MTVACACFAANDVSNKAAVLHLPAPEITAIRGAVGSMLAFALVLFVHGAPSLKTITNKFVTRRALLESLMGPTLVTCYAFLPLATVTAVLQIGPFLAMIAGIYLFGEQVGWRRWCAVFVGFAGVMLIIKPGGADFQPIAIVVLAAALITVARDIQSRKIGSAAPPFVVSLATAVVGTVLSLVLTPIVQPFGIKAWGPWVWPDAYSLALCGAAGVFMVGAHTFTFLAFRSGDMSVVAPFRYFYLFFAVIGGIFVFSEHPDYLSLTGMALIVAGGLYLLHRERMRSRHATAAATSPGAQ